MNNWSTFLGRFHPLLVHLPLGILLLAVVMQWLSRRKKYESISAAVPLVWLLGAAGAVLSCITGYLLSLSGEYEEGNLFWHQWMGIATAVFSFAGFFLNKKQPGKRFNTVVSTGVFLLLMITGHYGGSLTHGSEYLTEAIPPALAGLTGIAPAQPSSPQKIENLDEAVVYTQLVVPVLKEKCYSCHNAEKKKGDLQMHTPELLEKGGKNGAIIVAREPGKSELLQRIVLPLSDKKHMSPKGKPQITPREMELLNWWVASGASFTAKVKDANPDEKTRKLLAEISGAGENELEEVKNIPDRDVPAQPIAPASSSSMMAVTATGALLMPVSTGSNYLTLQCMNAPDFGAAQVPLLEPLKTQLVRLMLGNTALTNEALASLPAMPNLVTLHLDNTAITDEGLAFLTRFPALKYLNVKGTKISAQGLLKLKDLKQLRTITVYQTNVDAAGSLLLKQAFPTTNIIMGGYVLPTLASDTTRVEAPPNKK